MNNQKIKQEVITKLMGIPTLYKKVEDRICIRCGLLSFSRTNICNTCWKNYRNQYPNKNIFQIVDTFNRDYQEELSKR